MIHGSSTKKKERDLAQTPPFVFQYALDHFGLFKVDLAATEKNTHCEYYYDKENDALQCNWYEEFGNSWGWLNPPYSDLSPWYHKAWEEGQKGFRTVMLVPTFNGEAHNVASLSFAAHCTFIIGRIPFLRPNGQPMRSNPRGSMLLTFGPGDTGVGRPSLTLRSTMESRYKNHVILGTNYDRS